VRRALRALQPARTVGTLAGRHIKFAPYPQNDALLQPRQQVFHRIERATLPRGVAGSFIRPGDALYCVTGRSTSSWTDEDHDRT
jgi:hypothetical protein